MPAPFKLRLAGEPVAQPSLPRALQALSRSADREAPDPLIADLVTVQAEYLLASASRGAGDVQETPLGAQLLALEAEDGTTVFIRADRLAEDVARLQPQAVSGDTLDLTRFRDPQAASRGLGDWLWRRLQVLDLKPDGLVEQAKGLALEWAQEKLGAGGLEERAHALGSHYGTKALMQVIESRLAGQSGLYAWTGQASLGPSDRRGPDDTRLTEAARRGRMLVLVHGTASSTLGSYAALAQDAPTWRALQQRFPGGIYGYEHRTFSQSPAQNALELLASLPDGAQVSLLTHSRGGLVGDLVCLSSVPGAAIDAYGNQPPAGLGARAAEGDAEARAKLADLEAAAAEERQRLRDIVKLKASKPNLRIERYVRVACPARGTRLLSDNLDVFLSILLGLAQKAGAALASALATPVAGQAATGVLGVFKRVVLEIAANRLDPRLVPGIAAMGVESPLAAFLADPRTARADVAMAVVAGDTEFENLGLDSMARRVANLFADWTLFDRYDNDLVVDTDSMYAGLGFRDGTRYLYDRNDGVDHFRYFRNSLTRDALRAWLVADRTDEIAQFQPLAGTPLPWKDRRAAARGAGAAELPVVIFLPGTMGSHLEVDRRGGKPGSGSRIWFDFFALNRGELGRIADPAAANVAAEDLFEMFYGELADHLAATHAVRRFPYDWRLTPADAAQRLKTEIEQALAGHPGQPIRLLAHSMGGLVVRALIALHPGTWQQVVDSGGRLVMLGTPNHGSHLLAHTLLGKSGTMRQLTMVDVTRDLQEVVDLVGGFPGALSLLPRPGFEDSGTEPRQDAASLYQQATWAALKAGNRDRWFNDGVGARPPQPMLDAARAFWQLVAPGGQALLPHAERISYVFGQAKETPCGLRLSQAGGSPKVELLFTPHGDGSVTWASGTLEELLANNRCWYMPVEHADLTDSAEHFPAIVDLLETGQTGKLDRLPKARGTEAVTYTREAAPPVFPNPEELARGALGSGPKRRASTRGVLPLQVCVRAGDLRFAQQPLLCGHYVGDAIAGAEAVLDEVLEGRLTERDRLGLYAGELGSSAIVLMPTCAEDALRGSHRGAVIVGLGDLNGQLSPQQVTQSVRAAVLRLLMLTRDALDNGSGELQLASLLLGYSSSPNISIAESLAAVTLGVSEANRQFADGVADSVRRQVAVTSLEFIELYLDTAISAARALRDLPQRLATALRRTRTRIEPARVLVEGPGARRRLRADNNAGYWPRLIVTDADAADTLAAAKCEDGGLRRTLPQRLKYVFLSRRARAETVVQPRQPGVAEALIKEQLRSTRFDDKLGRILFQLMLPLDFKPALREQSTLMLMVDDYSANLPWEMLQPEDEPLVLGTSLVRQLATTHYRSSVRTSARNTACLIVDPSTEGYGAQFGKPGQDLPQLQAAVREGEAVQRVLQSRWADAQVTYVPSKTRALDVLAHLLERPYRVLVIAAHGVFEARAADGSLRTGVVLSDGILLTAVEIAQMEVVPELVFLNCCHLGQIGGVAEQAAPNKLAASIARELIGMGVRCIVAAGWAVDDQAASTFAETFFDTLLGKSQTFSQALQAAREETWTRHRDTNTWGAYQAYGDPDFRLCERDARGGGADGAPASIDELLDTIQSRRVAGRRGGKPLDELNRWVHRRLAECPEEWAREPQVQQALAGLYADLGDAGFDAARGHYLRAISEEDRAGGVAIRAIEQLANLEARTGERRGAGLAGQDAKAAHRGRVDALALVDTAIARMRALEQICRAGDAPAAGLQPNAERWSILGSALKRRAVLQAEAGAGWKAVSATLAEARDAYALGLAANAASTPYQVLNRLQLDWLIAARPRQDWRAAIALAERAAADARAAFGRSWAFFDAIGPADAALTIWLLGGLPQATADSLLAIYRQATVRVSSARREFEAVLGQLRLLGRCLQLRAAEGDAARAKLLAELAERVLAGEAAVPAAQPEAATDADGEGAGEEPAPRRAGTTKRTPAKAPRKATKTAAKTPARKAARK